MTAPALALYLAHNTHTIAANENAAHCYTEIKTCIDAIEHIINRPIPPRFCGPCPTLVDHRAICGVRLTAPRHDIEVTCPKCHTTHNVERLIERLLNDCGDMIFAVSELSWILRELNEGVPEKTLYRWCKGDRIPVRGYLSPNGTIIPDQRNQADRALFRLNDVREFVRTTRRRTAA